MADTIRLEKSSYEGDKQKRKERKKQKERRNERKQRRNRWTEG